MGRDTVASLRAELDALKASIASAPAAPVAARTWATKAEREAGNGFPCTVKPSCGRTDLRGPAAGASHDPKAPHWHNAAKPKA